MNIPGVRETQNWLFFVTAQIVSGLVNSVKTDYSIAAAGAATSRPIIENIGCHGTEAVEISVLEKAVPPVAYRPWLGIS